MLRLLLLFPLLLLVVLLPKFIHAFSFYLTEEYYCTKALTVGDKMMGKPIELMPPFLPEGGEERAYRLTLARLLQEGHPPPPQPLLLTHGDSFRPGERIRVSFNISSQVGNSQSQWVAEADKGSRFHTSRDPPFTVRLCEEQGVARAVPEGGQDFVVWQLPEAEEETATIRMAFAPRYGTVYVTESVTLVRSRGEGRWDDEL